MQTLIYNTHSYSKQDIPSIRDYNLLMNVNIVYNKTDLFTNYTYKSLILDSGITGTRISIDEYVNFLKLYRSNFDFCFSYDIMGEVEESYQNFKYLEKFNLDVVPVFAINTGTLEQFAEYYSKYHFIAIGGLLMIDSTEEKLVKLRTFKNEFPDKQIHILGCGIPEIIQEIKPFSVDMSNAVGDRRWGEWDRIIRTTTPSEFIKLNMRAIEREIAGQSYIKKEKKNKKEDNQISWLEYV